MFLYRAEIEDLLPKLPGMQKNDLFGNGRRGRSMAVPLSPPMTAQEAMDMRHTLLNAYSGANGLESLDEYFARRKREGKARSSHV